MSPNVFDKSEHEIKKSLVLFQTKKIKQWQIVFLTNKNKDENCENKNGNFNNTIKSNHQITNSNNGKNRNSEGISFST